MRRAILDRLRLVAALYSVLFMFTFKLCYSFSVQESVSYSTRGNSDAKDTLLSSLDSLISLNAASEHITELVSRLTQQNPTQSPGSTESFMKFAPGTWKVIYAPHIYTMGNLAGGGFDPVIYDLREDGFITSHARYNFPLIGSGWLSVSGTFTSDDNRDTCRVDFDKTWVKFGEESSAPYNDLESVPPSAVKRIIQSIGKLLFIPQVSVFPVSYLDNELVVFDFELIGTRICARKVGPPGLY